MSAQDPKTAAQDPDIEALLKKRMTYVFASKCIFHRPEDLIQLISSEDIECTYRDDQFTVTCPFRVKEATLRAFGDAWRNYIDDALKNKKNALEGARVSIKEPFLPTFDWEETAEYLELSPETQERLDRRKQKAELEEPQPSLLIEHELLTRDFIRQGLSSTPVHELYDHRVLRDIQNVTNCRLELNQVSGSITMKGDSKENLDRAIVKLENIEKMHAQRLSRPWKSSFYITKHTGPYRFFLIQDNLLNDRALSKAASAYYRLLKQPWNENLGRYQVQTFARQAIVYDWETSRLWLDYVYPALGKAESNPANWLSGSVASTIDNSNDDHPILANSKVDEVKSWLPKPSELEALENPFKPKADYEFDDQEKPPKDPGHYLTRMRLAKGINNEDSFLSDNDLVKQNGSKEAMILDEAVAVQPRQESPALLVNEEWPSPEEAMPVDSYFNRQMRKLRNDGKSPQVASTPTPAATSPPKFFIGPVARLAALNQAKLQSSSALPPPIEAPFMPLTTQEFVPFMSSRNNPPKAPKHSKKISSPKKPIEKAPPMVDDRHHSLIDTPNEPSPRETRGLVQRSASTKQKPGLNPMAPSWEPLQALRLSLTSTGPQPQEQPLIDLNSGNGTAIEMQDLFETVSTVLDEGLYESLPQASTLMEQGSNTGDDMLGGSPELVPGFPALVAEKEPPQSDLLIDLSDSNETIVETREGISEADTRLFLGGALLQAPQVQQATLLQDGHNPIYHEIVKASIEVLEMIRTVRGQVTLQLHLGHVLVPYLPYHKFPFKAGFSRLEWSEQMNPSKPWSMGKHIAFSRVLTKHWFDAEWMIDCENLKGERTFDESTRQSRVFYELKCRNKMTETEHLITLETDGSYEITTLPNLEAEINIVFLDHNWDAQLIATNQLEPELLDKQALGSIIENLYIPGGSNLPEIFTRCKSRFTEITSFVVKRRYSYEAAACSDFALQMTEIIDLPFKVSKHNQLYHAVGTEKELNDENLRWYEASIISTAAQSILTENARLEVGEYAKWTTERVAGAGFVQDLLDLAVELVANSDAVGCPTEGFLPETDKEKKAAAAAARAMYENAAFIAEVRRAPAPGQRPVVVGAPLEAMAPVQLVHAVHMRLEEEEEAELLGSDDPQPRGRRAGLEALERPEGFW